MDPLHGFGIGDDKVIVAPVVLLTTEMLGGQVLHLQTCSHRPVKDKYFLFEGVEVFAICIFPFCHVVPS